MGRAVAASGPRVCGGRVSPVAWFRQAFHAHVQREQAAGQRFQRQFSGVSRCEWLVM